MLIFEVKFPQMISTEWAELFNILIWMFKECVPTQFAMQHIPHAALSIFSQAVLGSLSLE